jgi:hypothetical protein
MRGIDTGWEIVEVADLEVAIVTSPEGTANVFQQSR